MKLGSETNRVINHVLSRGVAEGPVTVGMGATELLWSDRHALTVDRMAGAVDSMAGELK